jgi:hypothetical protein
MRLEGSCQCGKVRFTVESDTVHPFMFCYCSICRKTTGALTSNIMGRRETLKVAGRRHLRRYHAIIRAPGRRPRVSEGERWFCRECGTHLYVLDDRWPEGVWPNAAAIDTELPEPPERVHIMLRFKPRWVPVCTPGPRHREYPPLSIAGWHEKHGLTGKPGRRSIRRKGAR